MGKRSTQNGQDRATALDAEVRRLLAAGDARGALYEARHYLDWAAAQVRRTDPARAALIDAALAGSFAVIAAALKDRQPPRVAGYTGGPPSADHLIAAYTNSRTEAQGRQSRAR